MERGKSCDFAEPVKRIEWYDERDRIWSESAIKIVELGWVGLPIETEQAAGSCCERRMKEGGSGMI